MQGLAAAGAQGRVTAPKMGAPKAFTCRSAIPRPVAARLAAVARARAASRSQVRAWGQIPAGPASGPGRAPQQLRIIHQAMQAAVWRPQGRAGAGRRCRRRRRPGAAAVLEARPPKSDLPAPDMPPSQVCVHASTNGTGTLPWQAAMSEVRARGPREAPTGVSVWHGRGGAHAARRCARRCRALPELRLPSNAQT
jgi:hypothetical protein